MTSGSGIPIIQSSKPLNMNLSLPRSGDHVFNVKE